MPQALFRRKTDVQDYLTNSFNYKVYQALVSSSNWENLFEPLTFFNLLYEYYYEIIKNDFSKPLDVISSLAKLELDGKQHFFLLDCLLHLLYNFIVVVTDPMDKDFYQPVGYWKSQSVRNAASNIIYNDFVGKQNKAIVMFTIIERERDKLQAINNIELFMPEAVPLLSDEDEGNPSILKLSSKQGVKVNIIRILNALHQLNFFTTLDGDYPTKAQLMKIFGEFLGEDFSNYSVSLESALNVELKTHLEIFDKLKKTAESQWNTKHNKK